MLLAIHARSRSDTPPWKRGVVVKLAVRVSDSPSLLRGRDETEAACVCGMGFGVPEVPEVWKTWETACVESVGFDGQSMGISVDMSLIEGS
jgi:hypothetical protein